MYRPVISLIALCAISFAPLAQEPNPRDLEKLTQEQKAEKAKAEQLAKESEKIEAEILKFKSDLRRAAAESESYEIAGRDIDARLTKLSRDANRISAQLSDGSQHQSELIAALQRLSANPPPAIIGTPKTSADAARAAMIMKDISRQLRERSQKFSQQLSSLENVRGDITKARETLDKNEAELAQKRSKIRTLVNSKTERASRLSKSQKAAQERAAQLAEKADSLRELIARFERVADDVVPRIKPAPGTAAPRIKPKPGIRPPAPLNLPDGARFADARGALKPPVQGNLRLGYGSGRKGYTVSTRSNAQVTAPFAGRIEFAGAFKNYDNVVILNVGENYFMLLTGLGEIFVSSGELVTAGEPLGLMPASAANTELYIELRKNGTPINPKPWLGNAYTQTG